MNTLNKFSKNLLIGLTVLGMSGAALSAHAEDKQPTREAGEHRKDERKGPDGRDGKFGQRMEHHLARLHDKLKLTPAQEPAWTAFTAAAKPKAPVARPERAAFARLTAPERLEKWIAMSKDRTAQQESRLGALKTLYAALTPEQRKTFDDSVPGGEHGGRHHGHRGHGPQRGH